MDVLIRAAYAEDRDSLGALKLRSSLAWGDHTEELQKLPEAGEIPAQHLQHVILAELHGEIVGFVTVLTTKRSGELEDLFVTPEVWRNGIGKQLLAKAERRAVLFGVQSLHVTAGARVRPFYEACGYRFARTIATEFEIATKLIKHLS